MSRHLGSELAEDVSAAVDVLIVGAGSSGCALAARLSEDPNRTVMLVEAGRLYPTEAELPDELRRAASQASNFPGHPDSWSFTGNLTAERATPIVRGKVVGGSSAVNGTYFIRGVPEDFDSWAAQGNDRWSYQEVLPYFIRLERDLDYSDWYHGVAGPVPVVRPRYDELPDPINSFLSTCVELGFPEDPDKNCPTGLGVGLVPQNQVGGVRMSTYLTHLRPALDRSNLRLVPNALVTRVVFSRNVAIGVEVMIDNRLVELRAAEVVLSAGAIKSPHLLMLSGVGSAGMLREHGIRVVSDLPGVGKNFMDHPSVSVTYAMQDFRQPLAECPHIQVALNYTSDGSANRGDTQILPSSTSQNAALIGKPGSRASLFGLPGRFFAHPMKTAGALRGSSARNLIQELQHGSDMRLRCAIELPESRGEISLTSPDPSVPPRLDYNYLSEVSDRRRLREAVKLSADVLHTKEFRRMHARITGPSMEELGSRAQLDRWVGNHIGTAFHLSCSCRMGPASDASAVVDQFGRVYGVQNLRVIDTSIMPTIVRRGPNATAIMMGERAAAFFEHRERVEPTVVTE